MTSELARHATEIIQGLRTDGWIETETLTQYRINATRIVSSDFLDGLKSFVAALSGDRSGLKARLSSAPLKLAFDGTVANRTPDQLMGEDIDGRDPVSTW